MNYGQCQTCFAHVDIGFSGIDALVLGCMDKVGYICVTCAANNKLDNVYLEGTLI